MTEPMPDDERMREREARLQLTDFVTAVHEGDSEGARAALAAGLQTMRGVDIVTYRDSVHLPEDAGVWADDLAEMLHRVPDGWGRWISCGRGWYPLLARLNERIRALAPAYEIHQVKEKYGELRFYWGGVVLEPMPDDPEPPSCPADASDEERAERHQRWVAWNDRFEAWRGTPEGEAWATERAAIAAQIEALVDEAEAASMRTCERCGEAGSLCCTQARSAWYSTRCARCAAADGLITIEAYEAWEEAMRPEWDRKERLDFLSRVPGRARLIATADERLYMNRATAVCAATPEEAVSVLEAGGIKEIWLGADAVGEAVVAWLGERYAGHDPKRPVYRKDGRLAYTAIEPPEDAPTIYALTSGVETRPLADAVGIRPGYFPGIALIYGAEVAAELAADTDSDEKGRDGAAGDAGAGLAGSVTQMCTDEELLRSTSAEWTAGEDEE